MHLEKLEIQGFKSFANKNMLVFPDPKNGKRGITVVVGPNGSGKSNIADAVRWALGEQSMKMLRGKKSEDVIFSGSDKKGKLGMSEVSLYLNNEDRHAPLDYSEIVITRRLYRNGESEYLLNGGKARLSDIQMLLAKSNFGQKTYSVIGQGMVEGFLNTSLSERKEFFDEATGVKQFQIKRDDALNKLRSSYENLNQANMLLTEIEPRLKSLTRQVNKLKKRDEIEAELKGMQLNYYAKLWHEMNSKFKADNASLLELEKSAKEKEKKLEALNREHQAFEQKGQAGDSRDMQKEISGLSDKRDELVKKLAVLDARKEVMLEGSGQFDLSWLENKKQEYTQENAQIDKEIKALEHSTEKEKNKLKEVQQRMQEVSNVLNELNEKPIKAESSLEGTEVQSIINALMESIRKIDNLSSEENLEKIRPIMQEIKKELESALKVSEIFSNREGMAKIRTDILDYGEVKESVAREIGELRLNISLKEEQIKMFAKRKEEYLSELSQVESKLSGYKDVPEQQSENPEGTERKKLQAELETVESSLGEAKGRLDDFSKKEEESRKQIFDLQRNIQQLQGQLNELNRQISEIKISATRHETKLEDLELEIRQSLCSVKEVKDTRVEGEVDYDLAADKINSLKKQLDMIGGIDPEIEKEYIDTKEKYDYLAGQTQDLSQAIGSLEKIIKELDLNIKEKFDKEFRVISNKFEEYFKVLFNGGSAKIIKVMENEMYENEEKEEQAGEKSEKKEKSLPHSLDLKKIKYLQKHNATGLAGVEIQATPPGKKIKTLSMLSGGERAMTAIALICAIISANPSPFVVLDEVDAALDEANSERLAKILDDLSNKTQFIVISHNRATMRKAQILYGVTMQDDGVSKLLSVKLEEAVKIK